MSKEYLALFDLDGTLFDTGLVNYHAYKEALQSYQVDLDEKYFVEKCNGRHYTVFLPEIMGTTSYLEEVHAAKKEAYVKHLGKARENRHLFQILEGLRTNYYTALVTTASRQNTLEILECFHRTKQFDLLITQEDIVKPKPDPQGFCMAMEHFGIEADYTVIFEDSEVGLRAARATGATVIAIEKF